MKYLASLAVYAGIGGSAALVEWGVFYALVRLAIVDYVSAAVAGFLVATAVNYVLSRKFGFFRKNVRQSWELTAVYAVSAAALLLNLAVMVALVEAAGANIMVAKILGTGCSFLLNYAGRQFWVFDARPRHSAGRWLQRIRGKR